ncbi:unnamed protein product, partial [Prorocentrum cordatum]
GAAALAAVAEAVAAGETPSPAVLAGLVAVAAEASGTAAGAKSFHAPAYVPSGPPKPRVLVIGDENLKFAAGLQKAYPDTDFTAVTVLSRHNLESYGFDPLPQALFGRVQHSVDPSRVSRYVPPHHFDGVLLFLPGLGFAVPRELGSSDLSLFAWRTHVFVFSLLRSLKQSIRADGGRLHLVWPDEVSLMSSPCGAAGIELFRLLALCGCRPAGAEFEVSRLEEGSFSPFLLGDVPTEVPEWLGGVQVSSFTFGKGAISIPEAAGTCTATSPSPWPIIIRGNVP